MEARVFRARSMREALRLVRHELGPDAAVLYTRQLRGGLLRRLFGANQIEVTASAEVRVPSRVADTAGPHDTEPLWDETQPIPPVDGTDYRQKFRDDLHGQISDMQTMLEDLCRTHDGPRPRDMSAPLFDLYAELIDAEVSEELARELVEHVRTNMAPDDWDDPLLLKARLARLVEEQITVCGPIRVSSQSGRLVALVGPTGVGKTTTIAKLAANFHLRDRHRVGLITVDTFRIAAVDQLRTYADIIDLPMEVVSTPRDMRSALDRLRGLDLILMDTAGRSPRDEVQIQQLRSILAEAQPDEVHLVLSCVASITNLKKTAAQFAPVGTTALVLTKLDEATGLGNVIPLLRSCQLPLSYLTNGQNVPDDIEAAECRRLARAVLGMSCYV